MAEKLINGRTVRYDRLPAPQAYRLLLRILKTLGPASNLLKAHLAPSEEERDGAVLDAIMAFLATMDDDAVYDITLELVKNCRSDGKAVTDADLGVMALAEMMGLAQFALVTEFGHFFEDGAGSVLLKGMTGRPN